MDLWYVVIYSFQIENNASSASDEQVAESPTDYQEITIQGTGVLV